jgi:hypothetical protein
MTQKDVHRLVLDVVRDVALGRPVAADTDFSDIGIGRWQRQRFFGPLRDAFNQHGVDITGVGVTRECFAQYRTLRDVQGAVWRNVRPGPTRVRPSAVRPTPKAETVQALRLPTARSIH